MKRLFLLCISMFISLFAFSQKQTIDCIETKDDYYKWISFLSEGPIKWIDEPIDNVEGEAYRFVVTSSDIYNQIYIERINIGPEGCCRKLTTKKEVPLGKIFLVFNILGERSGVKFIKWESPTSLLISICKTKYLLENIGKDNILIHKL